MSEIEEEEGRGDAESHLSDNEAFLSYEIVESSLQKRPPLASSVPTKSTDFLELSFRDLLLPEEGLKLRSSAGSDSALPRDSSQEEIYLHTDVLFGRETMHNLPKSFSAKAVMLDSTWQSARKSPFGLLKRTLEHITKSKSQRNHRVLCRSSTNQDSSTGSSNQASSTASSSPAHLHATLEVQSEHHGAPQYEFFVVDGDDPEDVLSANAWRSDSASSWVYTFHSSTKKSREGHGRSPPIIGQMQASCCLCPQAMSTETKFILYDIARARRSSAAEGGQPATAFRVSDAGSESPYYPLDPTDLHPHLEIAAIVTRTPFNELRARERPQLCSSSSSGSTADQAGMDDCSTSPARHVQVVAPSGTHGSPRTSVSLLDRWRLGGGCDCGGWDVACPVVVLGSPCAADVAAADCSVTRAQQPILLFIQVPE